MIFSPEEHAARNQFHKLFCTKYLYTGEKNGALNEDSWNCEVLCDILHGIYEENPLTPEDIRTMVEISGMCDIHNELFFHLHENTPVDSLLLTAISPFITTEAFVKCKQRLQGRDQDTVADFLQCCCTKAKSAPIKIPASELYDIYAYWCGQHKCLKISKRAFNGRLHTLGFVRKKGYINGLSGVSYYKISIDMEAIELNAEQSNPARAKQTQEFPQHKDVYRPGDELTAQIIPTATRTLSTSQSTQDTTADSAGNFERNVEDDSSDEDPDDDSYDWESDDDTDQSDFDDEPTYIQSSGYNTFIDISPKDADGDLPAKIRVQKLPIEIRNCFKMMKATYRVAPEHFDDVEFDMGIKAAAGPLSKEQLNNLRDLFYKYAQ